MNSTRINWGDRYPIVAILRGVTPRESPSIGEALVDSSINAIEVPLNSPCPFDSIRRLTAAVGEYAMIGAGTVLCVEDVKRVADAGGQFVVSPNTDPDVVQATLQAGLESMPGVMSPSEAFTAVRSGAKALKIFPAGTLGPAYLRDLGAVLPERVALFAVGGIALDNVWEWIPAGAHGIGVGSALYRPGDTPERVTNKARALVQGMERPGGGYEPAVRRQSTSP